MPTLRSFHRPGGRLRVLPRSLRRQPAVPTVEPAEPILIGRLRTPNQSHSCLEPSISPLALSDVSIFIHINYILNYFQTRPSSIISGFFMSFAALEVRDAKLFPRICRFSSYPPYRGFPALTGGSQPLSVEEYAFVEILSEVLFLQMIIMNS